MTWKIGDKVEILDLSYSFGIWKDRLVHHMHGRGKWEVAATGLTVIAEEGKASGPYSRVNDVLLKNGEGDFMFIRSEFLKREKGSFHTITIDGVDLEISNESYRAFKKQFCE